MIEKKRILKMNKKLAIILISILLLLGLFFGFSKFNGNNSGSQTDESAAETETKNDYDYLILVNKQNKLPDDWEEKVVLKESVNRYGETYLVEEKALEQFLALQKELAEEGIIIELDSTYRSVQEQQDLWDEWTVEFGEEYVKTYVAVPGYSEHHTGLAIDICLDVDGKRINDNDEMIAEKEIFAKIHEHLAEHGFILRYLEGKEDITGYGYEPWHFRYIDDPALAKQIMDQGITFEEYLNQ
jgi:D-alanyl-D-alanine carboxypeptidase